MKLCIGCGEAKPLDDFYRTKNTKDGRYSRCKPCHQEQSEAARRERIASGVEAERRREYYSRTREKQKKWHRRYRERHPDRLREGNARRRSTPEGVAKQRARNIVRWALATGRIKRPDHCPECGEPEEFGADGRSSIHAHHEDYDRPLDIRWLCYLCHMAEHRSS